jgi:hypothetical protein
MRPLPSRPWALLGLASCLMACGPMGPIAGGPLPPGEDPAPTDWSFTDHVLLVELETRGEWLRRSVTVLILSDGERIYVPSRNAGHKRWVANVLRDPRVRVRIDGRTYSRHAVRVTDPAELVPLARVFLRKYLGLESRGARFEPRPPAPGEERADLWFFRLDPVEAG